MKTTLNIPDALLKEAMTVSKSRTKTEAVISGLMDLIRQKRLKGSSHLQANWDSRIPGKRSGMVAKVLVDTSVWIAFFRGKAPNW